VLNVELAELQASLMQEWRLPDLLTQIFDTQHRENSSVRTVELAARLARHTAQGWDNAAVPDDIADIAALLILSPAATLQLAQNV
jgi:HD-like signal output (HDOD) protein